MLNGDNIGKETTL